MFAQRERLCNANQLAGFKLPSTETISWLKKLTVKISFRNAFW